MFKIILILIFSMSLYAGVWSSMGQSGFSGAYSELNQFVSTQNKEIDDFWNNEIKPLIEEINKESKAKNEKLTILRELEKAVLLSDKLSQKIVEKINQMGGSQLPLSPFDNTIITFYSDRNLNEKMEFKNPKVKEFYENKEKSKNSKITSKLRLKK